VKRCLALLSCSSAVYSFRRSDASWIFTCLILSRSDVISPGRSSADSNPTSTKYLSSFSRSSRYANAFEMSLEVVSISCNKASIRTADMFMLVATQSRAQTLRRESRRRELEDQRKMNRTRFGKVFGSCSGYNTLFALLENKADND